MNDLIPRLDISRLIVKDLNGEIKESEKQELKEWINESEENKALYLRVRERENRNQRLEVIRKLNKQAAWREVERKTRKSQHFISGWLYKGIAVAIPVILLFCLYYYRSGEVDLEVVKQEHREIHPGEIKAELILANGQRLALDAKKENPVESDLDGVKILKENQGIRYECEDLEGEVPYHELRVPRGGEYPITLEDGTEVYFNSETRFRYPVKFGERERKVFLVGEAYFKVKREADRPFIVEMGENRIEVLGTEFNARYYPEENKQMTTLVSGKVKFISKDDKSLVLAPGEQAVLTDEGILSRKTVDITLYTAWKDGNFVFRKQRLEEVLNTLARWYDVDIFYEDVSRKDIEFTGNIQRFERFEEIVGLLQMTGDTEFEVKGKSIFVRRK
ncbi:FecR family protein [Butyricimonas paravirosa]|uniref:FecR family protein n=1 Tax=Butyricimonas paravirosa TaxID=1472417 RepID=UPI0022E50B1E|nr:FecR family protein [Butyricimonas paravirosa]